MLIRFVATALLIAMGHSFGAPCSPTVEYKSASVERIKTGYPERYQTNPPEWKIYKTKTRFYNKGYDEWFDSHSAPPDDFFWEQNEYENWVSQFTALPDGYTIGTGTELGCPSVSPIVTNYYSGTLSYYCSGRSNGV